MEMITHNKKHAETINGGDHLTLSSLVKKIKIAPAQAPAPVYTREIGRALKKKKKSTQKIPANKAIKSGGEKEFFLSSIFEIFIVREELSKSKS